jgi:hypothetical protein
VYQAGIAEVLPGASLCRPLHEQVQRRPAVPGALWALTHRRYPACWHIAIPCIALMHGDCTSGHRQPELHRGNGNHSGLGTFCDPSLLSGRC